MGIGQVLLVVAVVLEGAGAVTFLTLWLRSRHRQRLLRAKLHALQTPGSRGPRRLVPTGREAVKAVWDTANLVREKGLGGALRTSIDDLAGWAQVERPDLIRLAGPGGSLSILFSDIEGSTSLNEELGDKAWVRVLARHDRIVRSRVERTGGHVIKTQGDGFMVAFASPEQAVRCAIGIQQGLLRRAGKRAHKRADKPRRPEVAVRIGIHHGDVVHRSGDIFGRNVAQAARVAALAAGGEILVSEEVAEALSLVEDIVLTDTREVQLKGLSGPYVVTLVDWAA